MIILQNKNSKYIEIQKCIYHFLELKQKGVKKCISGIGIGLTKIEK